MEGGGTEEASRFSTMNRSYTMSCCCKKHEAGTEWHRETTACCSLSLAVNIIRFSGENLVKRLVVVIKLLHGGQCEGVDKRHVVPLVCSNGAINQWSNEWSMCG